jgi:drug/metabolite transporter (DMT)-like permease
LNKKILAILLFVTATFFGSLMGVFMRLAQSDINVFTASFLRFGIGFVIILPYLFYSKFKVYKTNNIKLHFIRGIINVPTMYVGFAALMFIPLEQIQALHFIVPLIVTFLAVFFFKEKIRFVRITALIIGLLGMLVMLRPGMIEMNIGVYMVLFTSIVWSFIIIITKFLSKNDSPITILTYQYSFVTFFSFFIVIFFWETPSPIIFLYTFLAALSGTILHIALIYSYKLVDLTLTQPFTFLSLIWASLFGYNVFGEEPDIFTWLGATIIFSGVLIIFYRESYLKKDITKESLPMKS